MVEDPALLTSLAAPRVNQSPRKSNSTSKSRAAVSITSSAGREAARKHIGDLICAPLLKWPREASIVTGVPEGLLRGRQAAGDSPRLTRIGRQTYVRPGDLRDWIDAHVEG